MVVARQPAAARCRVASPTPSWREIARQDASAARRSAILEASTTRRGRPRRFPLDCAFRRPALTRSCINARSTPYAPRSPSALTRCFNEDVVTRSKRKRKEVQETSRPNADKCHKRDFIGLILVRGNRVFMKRKGLAFSVRLDIEDLYEPCCNDVFRTVVARKCSDIQG